MKFGDMKYSVPIDRIEAGGSDYSFFERCKIRAEGKRLYSLHPEYGYLKGLRGIENNNDFKETVVYTYMAEQIVANHPELAEKLERYRKSQCMHDAYCFVEWYCSQLREKDNPGILEEERKKKEAEMAQYEAEQAKLKAQREAHKATEEWNNFQRQKDLQQDLAAGTRVICPYCKSADTKKISVASRAVSVSLVGAASGKIGKQWHCNHCGSDF